MDDREKPVGGAIGPAEALHDISNALTVLLGWLEEGARDDAAREEVKHAIEIATRKAREARALAREAIGASPPREVPRRVGDVVAEVIDALGIECERASVQIVVEGDGDGAEVRGGTALGHVVTNLLLNAIAFSPEGSTIRVRTTSAPHEVRVSIVDEGPGVEPNIAATLFEGRTSRPGGAGIGLRHAREVARRLGGDLVHVAPSEGDGRGAAFEVRIPRHDRQPGSPSEGPRRSSSSQAVRGVIHGRRVLIVEDDRAVCALLDAGLGARGVEVIALHDGSALPARLADIGSVDAVLLDLSPIAHDVAGSLGAVRAALPDAGIVFISGSAIALPNDLASDTNTRWVRKPFELGEITQAIAELLPKPRE